MSRLEKIERRRALAWRRYNGKPTRCRLALFVGWTMLRDECERAEVTNG